MARGLIRTDRLVLRPLVPEDAADLTAALQDWDVVRWLTSVPWPYGQADADGFIAEEMAGRLSPLAVTEAGSLLGVISAETELGYWLGKRHWGRGIMTEAGSALLARVFEDPSRTAVSSCYLAGNERSAGVLTKLGFKQTGPGTRFSTALNETVSCTEMALHRKDWSPRA